MTAQTQIPQEPVASTATRGINPLPWPFRTAALLEGISFLVLLLIAMPLKYLMGMPGLTSVVGMAHGLLFVAYVALILEQMTSERRGIIWGVLAFVASLVPCGTFIFVHRHQKAALAAS